MRRVAYLIYLFLFLLPWQTRLILRHGVLNNGNWEYGIVGIYGTEILLWLIILLSTVRIGRYWHKNTLSNFPAGNPPAGGALPAYRQAGRSASLVSLRSTPCPLGLREGFFSQYLPFLICLPLVIFFSIFLAADRLIAIQQFIHILEAVAIFILLTRLPIDCLKAAYAFLAGLALQAILGIYQFLTQSTFAFKWLGLTMHDAAVGGTAVLENSAGRWLRAYAGLPHPNVFGGYMAVGILLTAVVLSCFFINKKTKFFLLFINCLFLTGLFFSFSRSAWLGLAIGLAVYWFFGRRQFVSGGNFKLLSSEREKSKVICSSERAQISKSGCSLFFLSSILLLAIFSLLYAPLLKNRISGEGRLEAKSMEERAGGYGEAWQLFKKHPFLGVGLGSYTLAVHNEIDQSRPAWDYQPAHNVFLLMLTELGVIGVLVILFFCYLIGFKASRVLLPVFIIFFLFAVLDHYLWSLYSGLVLVGVGKGMLTKLCKSGKVITANK